MGSRFSHVHYRSQDATVVPHFQLLTHVWGLEEIALLSRRLRKISFNFCLTADQFASWLMLEQNPFFHTLHSRWFDTFKNTKSSTVVNGLELLTALALTCQDGRLDDKACAVFDIFDFDGSGMITLDELCILLKSVVRGLSKLTLGLGPRFVTLCPMAAVDALAKQCFSHCDLESEQDLPRHAFCNWVRQMPKVVNLVRCFVTREFLTEEDAALTIQRCTRGMQGRRIAAELRLDVQLELEEEARMAAQKIQEAVVTRKKRRDTMRRTKIERFAHHGALYTFGSDARAQLGHGSLPRASRSDIKPSSLAAGTESVLAQPTLSVFFKNNELRVVSAAVSSVHACAVASSGEVFTWGSGVPGSFGFLARSLNQRETESSGNGYTRRTPTRVEDLEEVAIASCALGNHHSVALSEQGAVYTWGSGAFGQLGHGDFHTDSHELFKMQFDQHNGREYPFVELPLQIDRTYFEEMRVVQLACGYYFTVAVCEDGSVFTWGEGSDGQLGVGYSDDFQVGYLDEHIHGSSFVYLHSPTRIDSIKTAIRNVAVGGNHVFAVARDPLGTVYEWGAWQRRGADAQESTFAPVVNEHLSTLGVDRIASGNEHSLAITARVSLQVEVDPPRVQKEAPAVNRSTQTFALCACFGARPMALSRALTGGLFVCSGQQTHTSASPTFSSSSASNVTSMLTAMVHEREDGPIRAGLTGCTGKIVVVDRSTWTGHWIIVPLIKRPRENDNDNAQGVADSKSVVEIPCVPATFGPELTDAGIAAKVWYSPEKLSSLRLYVRPDEVVGRIVLLRFDQDDITFDMDDLELTEMIDLIMISLVEKVKDAQESGAAAVVIVFDFLDADAFPLTPAEDDRFEFTIPVVMIKNTLHGETLLENVVAASKPCALVCYREDIIGKQIMLAQKNGAKAVVVTQNRIEQHPIRLQNSIFDVGNTKASDSLGVKIPVVMVPFTAGETIKRIMRGVDAEESTAQLSLYGSGALYAWGYAENGRLGLGDSDNEQLFLTGFDGARQTSYQYVEKAELVSSLFYQQITHIACGEEHSTAVSSDGMLYTWGSGRHGKLGNGTEEDEYAPHLVEALGSVRVVQTACGPHQTFAITSTPSISSNSATRK